MNKELLREGTGVYECAKYYEQVEAIIKDIDNNKVLNKDFHKDKVYLIKRFLFQELGCLKGITKESIEKK